jgi:hypothetical protein
MQTCNPKNSLDDKIRPGKILEMEIVDALPEDLGLMVGLKPET